MTSWKLRTSATVSFVCVCLCVCVCVCARVFFLFLFFFWLVGVTDLVAVDVGMSAGVNGSVHWPVNVPAIKDSGVENNDRNAVC